MNLTNKANLIETTKNTSMCVARTASFLVWVFVFVIELFFWNYLGLWEATSAQLGFSVGGKPPLSSSQLAKSRCQQLLISKMKFRRKINHPDHPYLF